MACDMPEGLVPIQTYKNPRPAIVGTFTFVSKFQGSLEEKRCKWLKSRGFGRLECSSFVMTVP